MKQLDCDCVILVNNIASEFVKSNSIAIVQADNALRTEFLPTKHCIDYRFETQHYIQIGS